MGSDTPVLAFDTSAAHCAAALLFEGRCVTRAEAMARGQAERLMPLLQELLEQEGLRFADLARIGVGTGPGNFTGIRIAVSAARGLGLALEIPVVGVSCLQALRTASGQESAAIAAPRGMAYVQSGDGAPQLLPVSAVPTPAAWLGAPAELVAAIAALARATQVPAPPPAPLYLRPADAAPARDAPPCLLDDA